MSFSIYHLPPVCNNELFWCDPGTIVMKFTQHNHSHLALVQLFSDKSATIICYNIGRKKPGSHFYMCWTEYDGNYCKSLINTPDHPPYIGIEGVFTIVPYLVKYVFIKFIITLLPKRLSIVFKRSILFSPFIVVRSVATKQSREANKIATLDLSGFAMIGREGSKFVFCENSSNHYFIEILGLQMNGTYLDQKLTLKRTSQKEC
jgi:hypothetical protein